MKNLNKYLKIAFKILICLVACYITLYSVTWLWRSGDVHYDSIALQSLHTMRCLFALSSISFPFLTIIYIFNGNENPSPS